MPALFSRKSRASASKAVSSASFSPTPSMADAKLLPNVPTKSDLPAIPNNDTTPSLTEFGARSSMQSSTLRAQGSKKAFLSPAFSQTLGSRRRTPSPSGSPNPSVTAKDPVPVPGETFAYGYTTKGWDTHLDASRVHAIVEACAQQIRIRGLDLPLLFSSMALDLSPTNVTTLISSYLGMQSTATHPFNEELEFANAPDLAALIKWALARMIRVFAVPVPSAPPKKGQPVKEDLVYIQQRGFLDLDSYTTWRESERSNSYPPTAYDDFASSLAPEVSRLLASLFALLASTVSYSFKNGMVPTRLSKHFGALLFGLPEDETFAKTYDAFIRASHATEHLLLAYIRAQATQSSLPPRLAQHIQGYPNMLTLEAALPSATATLVPITQIERTVRLYSPDLIQTACETDLAVPCQEWSDCHEEDIVLGKDPQLSDHFRKLINLRGASVQGRSSSNSTDPVNVHGSLANKQWDDFLFDGFTNSDASKLAFDLNESVRRNRSTGKRETVQWSDFTQTGFAAQGDETLSTALSFDDTLKQDVQNWPAERAQLTAKLRAGQEKLPEFNYDVTPTPIASPSLAGVPGGLANAHPISRFDESFADVWADYLVGNGWSNRDELTHRTASFVVVQYKSRPNASTVGAQSGGSNLAAPTRLEALQLGDASTPMDTRSDAAWFVVQEVVPAQYRADLEAIGVGKKSRLLNSHAVMRKLTQLRGKKEKQPSFVVTSRSPNRDDRCAEDVFQPGPGGTTRHLVADTSNRRLSSSSDGTSVTSTARDAHTPSRSEADHAPTTAPTNANGATKLMSSLRAKSLRVVNSTRRAASSSSYEQREMPHTAPVTSKSAILGGQRGDLAVDRSFTSADYETRSVVEPDTLENGSLVTAGPYTVPARKSSAQHHVRNSPEPWVDVQLKQNISDAQDQSLPEPVSVAEDVGPRSSTPLPPKKPAAERAEEINNDNDDDESQEQVRETRPLPAVPLTTRPVRSPEPVAAPTMDPAAAARAALKPRDRSGIPILSGSAATRGSNGNQIDAKKLVESLRAGLSPVEAVRSAKDMTKARPISIVSLNAVPRAESPVSPTVDLGSSPTIGYKDPFAKDPIAGRVADVASKFGGLGNAPAKLRALSPQPTGTTKSATTTTSTATKSPANDSGDSVSVDTLARSGLYNPTSPTSDLSVSGDEGWREPYQPGMPLDNVVEETDSVVA